MNINEVIENYLSLEKKIGEYFGCSIVDRIIILVYLYSGNSYILTLFDATKRNEKIWE